MNVSATREQLRRTIRSDEHSVVTELLQSTPRSERSRQRVLAESKKLVVACRSDKKQFDTLDALFLEYGLSNAEGLQLMCLAESLLRVPDASTIDRLIAEKLQAGNWRAHLRGSGSALVNICTRGLVLAKHLTRGNTEAPSQTVFQSKLLGFGVADAAMRTATISAMKVMGGQYVLGRTIVEGLQRGAKNTQAGTRYSFDMLGEGARHYADAANYARAYADAIDEIGQRNSAKGVQEADGISVKLSALHPHFELAQQRLVMAELLPTIKRLCLRAKHHNIGLTIDAEESYRLDLSLDIFKSLAEDVDLTGWQGLGFVLQAYQKRAPLVAQWLIELARQTGRRVPVRLVKGAYWDGEIKRAQELGLEDYAVYTRKAHTDLSYEHCAGRLLAAPEAVYPQFATHNAYTVAMIIDLAGDREFEFQRLHGMGHILYAQLNHRRGSAAIPVRVYAPIGQHADLLPYLVRRLLENGANSSFVNAFLDPQTPLKTLLQDTRDQVAEVFPYTHKKIARPGQLFSSVGEIRKNSPGLDLDDTLGVAALSATIAQMPALAAHAIIDGVAVGDPQEALYNPADQRQVIGHYVATSLVDVVGALASADRAQPEWNRLAPSIRAGYLHVVADLMERDLMPLVAMIVLEGGRTQVDAVSEVREAIDFCRYYGLQAQRWGDMRGRGVFLCISPWNFPLAIFVGQVAAALLAGNTVIAKPAPQTSAIATFAVGLFHRAGVSPEALQLVLGDGPQIAAALLGDTRIAGVAFTGSTRAAQSINRGLAARRDGPIPLIAETGGQNCMLVDSTALAEQVVDDVIASAFGSAGQRCSALRVLFLQTDIADRVLGMLAGAMDAMSVGDPRRLSSDLGPVIDGAAQQRLHAHIERMQREAILIAKVPLGDDCKAGRYVAPHAFEIDSLAQLDGEVFGPILHVIRYSEDQLDGVLEQIEGTGFGLTLGIHSRIEGFCQRVYSNTSVGNTYINRNMVGAVVGVNPFGGCGLSGTGPKAGGPNYLLGFSASAIRTLAVVRSTSLWQPRATTKSIDMQILQTARQAQRRWQSTPYEQRSSIVARALAGRPEFMRRLDSQVDSALSAPLVLPGPTGEDNQLTLLGRGIMVLVVTANDAIDAVQKQLASALLCGCAVVVAVEHLHADALTEIHATYRRLGLPEDLLKIVWIDFLAILIEQPWVAGVMANSRHSDSVNLRRAMAERSASIIPLIEWPQHDSEYTYAWLLGMLRERTRTENLVVRGGNAQLYNLADD